MQLQSGLRVLSGYENVFRSLVLAAAGFLGSVPVAAYPQTAEVNLSAELIRNDGLFWAAYNSCETVKFKDFFTADVEFYHDQGGVTVGAEALTESLKKNLCGGGGSKLRREEVAGTLRIFPLRKNNEIYGAIVSGEHLFYVTESGKPEFLDGRARYEHLWLKKDGVYKMARILSFDHRAVSPEPKKAELKLSSEGGGERGAEQSKI